MGIGPPSLGIPPRQGGHPSARVQPQYHAKGGLEFGSAFAHRILLYKSCSISDQRHDPRLSHPQILAKRQNKIFFPATDFYFRDGFEAPILFFRATAMMRDGFSSKA